MRVCPWKTIGSLKLGLLVMFDVEVGSSIVVPPDVDMDVEESIEPEPS